MQEENVSVLKSFVADVSREHCSGIVLVPLLIQERDWNTGTKLTKYK